MAQTVLRIPDAPPLALRRSSNDISSPRYAARLYTASYDNSVTPFDLKISDTAVSLIGRPANRDAGPDPTWLTIDRRKRKLFCLNEQLEPTQGKATLTEYDINEDGTLQLQKKVEAAPGGPVHSKFLPLGSDGDGVHVVAHYSPGTFTAFNRNLEPISKIDLAIGSPGPTERQKEGKSNGHGVVTHKRLGSLVLVPDLSQDKVWVIECGLSSCSIVSSIAMPPGTGPRHGTIWEAKSVEASNQALYVFVIGEISNNIEGYKIDISGAEPKFRHVSTTAATQSKPKEGYAAAEILTSPDGRYIVASNRANKLAKVEECDATFQNCTLKPCDTITTFRPKLDGQLDKVQSWSAAGASPRAFDFNAGGDMIAIGLEKRLAIIQRDVESGKLGQILIDTALADQVTSVVWDEVQDGLVPSIADKKQELLHLNE